MAPSSLATRPRSQTGDFGFLSGDTTGRRCVRGCKMAFFERRSRVSRCAGC